MTLSQRLEDAADDLSERDFAEYLAEHHLDRQAKDAAHAELMSRPMTRDGRRPPHLSRCGDPDDPYLCGACGG